MTDYKETLNLPSTDFPMRANLPLKEPVIQKKWEDMDLYGKLMDNNEGKPLFVMHDGPPYANGDMHLGHALNKTLKEFIMKSKNMGGYKTAYIHGWDTHGLPIENQLMKKMGQKAKQLPASEFRALCDEFARDSVAKQMASQKRIGVIGDWDNSYLTILPKFESKQIEVFGEMAEKGYIYKGLKPVYWCPKDETALAEAEIEYADDECDSIYVKFRISQDSYKSGLFPEYAIGKTSFVIWTTTTWTLPGNLAVCLNEAFDYGLFRDGDEYYILAEKLAEEVERVIGRKLDLCKSYKGSELERVVTIHPFLERTSLVINGDHVTLESGTGCVHTAPGHGVDDFEVCRKYPELDIVVPVDSRGRMTSEAGKYEGTSTAEAGRAILADLAESGALLATEHIVHQYPHCWRCKSPILFRATEQWFCSIEGFKEKALAAIKGVNWIPAWGEVRIENMVRDRSDWCISRQRKWGVPIPIFYCTECEKPIINKETIKKISALFEKEGSGAWYTHTPQEILGSDCICPDCGSGSLRAEQDIMDVWFDSGSSYAYVLDDFPAHRFPADIYLEGSDQYRGWFQSSLLTSVATRGVAPYKTVITHGFIVDGEGKKMSKSLGNGVDPQEIINTYGADVLRLWVSSVDYTSDVRISNDILKQLSEIYRKIRNSIRILIANIGDFDPAVDMVDIKDMNGLDRWALHRLNELTKRVRESYDSYQFHIIYHAIHNFCTIDMSSLYIDITKDILYCQRADSLDRRSAQAAMYRIAVALIKLIAPILSFTAEESWEFIRHLPEDNAESVFLNEMPEYNEALCYENEANYSTLFTYRSDVLKALEIARTEKIIGKSLEAKVTIYTDMGSDAQAVLERNKDILSEVFIVSKTLLSSSPAPEGCYSGESGISVAVSGADGEKCARCWMFKEDITKDESGQCLCSRCRDAVC